MEEIFEQPANWPTGRKAVLRFLFIFFCLFILFEPNGVVIIDALSGLYLGFLHSFITWASIAVLHMAKPITIFNAGSGDTTSDYLIILLIVVISGLGSLLWMLLEQRPRNYNKLYYWLTVFLRFYIAITMLNYGFVKVIKLQFPAPGLDRLVQPFGDASPMGLAWTYMGYSTGFNYFAGFAELTCGALLLFRRTTVLGAAMGLAVAGNIMAMNYAFDIPVKIVSTALVLMCAFLLAGHLQRLVNFFILNKPAPAADLITYNFEKRWKNITLTTLKYLLIAFTLVSYLSDDISEMESDGDNAPKPPLYGIYNVITFVQNRDTITPLTTNEDRWKRIVVNYAGYAKLTSMVDSSTYLTFKPDTVKKMITMGVSKSLEKFTYHIINKGQQAHELLWMQGKWGADTLTVIFNRLDEHNFRLMNRGFHWISEYPYNR